jgi:hypothetical protein
MNEQITEQTATTQSGVAPVPGQAAPATPAGSGLTKEQIQAAIDSNPELLSSLSVKAKIYGEEKPVALSELQKGYQISSAAQRQLEEANRIKREAEAEKARLAEQGDPFKRFADEIQRRNAPSPVDPLTQVDFDVDPITGGKVTAQQLAVEREARARIEAKLKDLEESKLPAAQQFAQEAVQSYNVYRTMDEQFREVRGQIPDFSARAVFGADGKPSVDVGSDPLTIATVRLANSDVPDPRFGNRPPKDVPIVEIYRTLENDLRGRFTAAEKARQEQADRERRTAAGVAAATGEAPALPSELAFTGKETRAERIEKAEKQRDYFRSLMPK